MGREVRATHLPRVATHLPRVSRGYYCVMVSFAALLWIALLQVLMPAGQPMRASHAGQRGSRAWATVLAGPQVNQSPGAVAASRRYMRAAPAPVARPHGARPSLANVATHLPRRSGGLPKGVSMGASGTRTGAAWAIVSATDPRELARVRGGAGTAADRTSRVIAARGRLLSYLPNPPPLG